MCQRGELILDFFLTQACLFCLLVSSNPPTYLYASCYHFRQILIIFHVVSLLIPSWSFSKQLLEWPFQDSIKHVVLLLYLKHFNHHFQDTTKVLHWFHEALLDLSVYPALSFTTFSLDAGAHYWISFSFTRMPYISLIFLFSRSLKTILFLPK